MSTNSQTNIPKLVYEFTCSLDDDTLLRRILSLCYYTLLEYYYKYVFKKRCKRRLNDLNNLVLGKDKQSIVIFNEFLNTLREVMFSISQKLRKPREDVLYVVVLVLLGRGIVDHKPELPSEPAPHAIRILTSILEKLSSFRRLNIDINNKTYTMIISEKGNERRIEIPCKDLLGFMNEILSDIRNRV